MQAQIMRIPTLALLCCGFFLTAAWGEQEKRQETVAAAVVGKDGVQRITVQGDGYSYTPNHILVQVNVPVELTVRKSSRMVPHNIVIKAPEAGIDFDEPMGTDPKPIAFTPKKTGKYPFYCTKKLLFFESHRDKGMEGTLEVTE